MDEKTRFLESLEKNISSKTSEDIPPQIKEEPKMSTNIPDKQAQKKQLPEIEKTHKISKVIENILAIYTNPATELIIFLLSLIVSVAATTKLASYQQEWKLITVTLIQTSMIIIFLTSLQEIEGEKEHYTKQPEKEQQTE